MHLLFTVFVHVLAQREPLHDCRDSLSPSGIYDFFNECRSPSDISPFCAYGISTSGVNYCEAKCVLTGCDLSLLGNGVCDEQCNYLNCGYDYADCFVCAEGCTLEMMSNDVCDLECANSDCRYDRRHCDICTTTELPACLLSQVGDGHCDPQCKSARCDFDAGDCECSIEKLANGVCEEECKELEGGLDDCVPECAPGCSYSMQHNSMCDPECNVEACGMDMGACSEEECAPGCRISMIMDFLCDLACLTYECLWDNFACVRLTQDLCAPGCSNAMAADSICQAECNQRSCFFDQYQCVGLRQTECAPGCTDLMIYFNHVCDPACDTAVCEFDLGTCVSAIQSYECAPGCNNYMLMNAVCDWECNVADCFFDSGDCQCFLWTCALYTMHLACRYGDYGQPDGCTDEADVRSALYNQILMRDFYALLRPENPPYCKQLQREEAFRRQECLPECNTREATYSMGMCATVLPAHCVVGWGPEEGECFECDTPQYFGHCVSTCPSGTEPVRIFSDLCANLTSPTTKSAPAFLYVREDTRASEIREGPLFFRFVDALVAAWEAFTVVSLIGSEVTFDVAMANWTKNVDYTTAWAFPDFVASGRWTELTIQSLPCSAELRPGCVETLTTLLLHRAPKSSIAGKRLVIKDVIITTKSYFNFDTVKECPVFISEADSSSYALRECAQFTDFSPFIVGEHGTLILDVRITQHVYFEDMTLRFKSLITVTTGTVHLVNSHFKNVQTAAAVILSECSSLADSCGTVSYEGGSVSYLNNARELGAGFSPFLIARFLQSVLIASVEFQLCFASDALLSIRDVKDFVISDCIFRSNVVFGSLLSIDLLLVTDTSPLNLVNLKFFGNHSKGSIVQITSSNTPRNVKVSNCWFEGNAGEAAISVTFASAPVPSNSVEVSTTSFLSNAACSGLLKVQNFASVTVAATEFRDNGDQHDEESVLKNFFNDSNIQASAYPALNRAKCIGVVVLEKCASSLFDNLIVTDNLCGTGGTGVLFRGSNAHKSVVTSALFARNVGSGDTAIGLHLSESTRAEVYNLTAVDNFHSRLGVIVLLTAARLLIVDSLFQRNSGGESTCISAQSTLNLTVLRCRFDDNEALLGDAAAIALTASLSQVSGLYLEVRNSTFTGNSAARGSALSIMTEVSSAVTLVLVHSAFLSNRASIAGASLYVSSDTDLSASIDECEFSYEQSENGAMNLQHSRGSVTLSHSLFRLNTGTVCSALCFDHGTQANLILEDIEFIDNTDITIVKLNRQVTSNLQTLRCVFHEGQTAISLQNTQWQDSFSVFRSFHATAVLLSSSRATIVGSEFDSNESPSAGGSLRLSESVLQCTACWFAGNTANTHGGAVFVERHSSLLLLSCSFRGNTASGQGAAVYAHSSTVTANSSAFLENVARDSSTLAAVSSHIALHRSSLSDNKALRTSGLWLIFGSTASISHCLFHNQTGIEAAFFLLEISSSALVWNCTFSQGTGWTAGAAFVSLSNLSISDSNFTNMEAQIAGVIYAIANGLVVLVRVRTTKTHSLQGGIVYIRTGKLSIASCQFAEYSVGGVNVEGVELKIWQSWFEGGQGNEGSAVRCVECSALSISETSFTSNRGEYGAVFLRATPNSSVVDSTFFGNSAEYGGAIFARSSKLHISTCNFLHNSALFGGALNLACTDSCTIDQSVFENNSATVSGGAIQWSSVPPVFSNLTFLSNAALIGPNMSSFLAKVLLFADVSGNYTSVIHGVSPGVVDEVSLVARLYDHYGQLLALDNTTTCKVRAVNETLATLAGATTAKATRGVLTFTDLAVSAEPKSTVIIEVHECSGISELSSSRLEVNLRECSPGESATGRVCLLCGNNSYGFDPARPCQSCPKHCTCLGNTTVFPNSGYWRIAEYSIDVRKCRNPNACLGGSSEAWSGLCAPGYESPMCQVCSSGYYSAGNFRCIECSSTSVAQGVFVVVGALLAISGLLWASIHAPKAVAYLRVLVSFFHTLYFVAEVGIEWPSAVEGLLEGLRRVAAPFHTAVPIDCWLSTSYNFRLVSSVVLPGALVLVMGALWLLVFAVTRTLPLFTKYWSKSVVTIYFFVYPTLVTSSFSVFSCTELEAGEYWLTFDIHSRCWTTKHVTYLVSVGVVSLLLWTAPLPFLHNAELLAQGLRDQCRAWEAFTHLRKLAMAAVTVLFVEKFMVQALVLQTVLWIGLIGHFITWPYVTEELSRLDFVSQLISALTLWCGILYSSTDSSSWFVRVAVIGSISLFPVFWLRELRRRNREMSLDFLIAVMLTPTRRLKCASMKSAYVQILRTGLGSVPYVSVSRSDLMEGQASRKVHPYS